MTQRSLLACLLVLLLPAASAARTSPAKAITRPSQRAGAPRARAHQARALTITEEAPRLFLSWHAPAGEPGATDTVTAVCADSMRVDTLWLSFEPTRDEPKFIGLLGELEIYSQGGDTLGGFWDMQPGGGNYGGLTGAWGPDSDFPGEQPWHFQGIRAVNYTRTRYRGTLKFFNVVPEFATDSLKAGHRYTVCRVYLRSKRPGLGGCASPACIAWQTAELMFKPEAGTPATRGGENVIARGGSVEACWGRIPAWAPRAIPRPSPHATEPGAVDTVRLN
jgi:hypothetical protein